jgi:hypothetical protein
VGQPAGWAPSVSEMRRAAERLAGGPGRNLFKFNIVQNHPNLIQTKTDFPVLQKFETRYRWKVFKIRNNFS